ncbi:MAG: hypothetical protein BZ138_00555 [Methanosphaera sp. rholeuAM270]|nr:MAG: hypothetical protein BZ138_00555 [Methanosphaera sp. rholeuAM270]
MINQGMINIRKFLKDTFNKGNFKDFFKRNRLFLLFALLIVLLSFTSGLNHVATDDSLMKVLFSPLSLENALSSHTGNGFIFYFLKNIIYSIYCLLLGLSFSILSILVVITHEVSIANNFSINSIFVIVNDVFVLVGAFLVGKIEKRFIGCLLSREFDEIYHRIKVPLKDLLLSVTLIFFLIILSSICQLLVI